jgi:hypothetical protein
MLPPWAEGQNAPLSAAPCPRFVMGSYLKAIAITAGLLGAWYVLLPLVA